jgi:catechol 2,3-dioxygenase-like lactoylglutathione lyase family enzyme
MADPQPKLSSIAPFFIVADVAPSIAFYRDRLGFEVRYSAPAAEPFFAVIGRDGVQIMLKAILPEIQAMPNPTRHPWASWDAFVHTDDPDALAAELLARGAVFHTPLGDTEDQLRGFEVRDPDGYVLFFGRPAERGDEP